MKSIQIPLSLNESAFVEFPRDMTMRDLDMVISHLACARHTIASSDNRKIEAAIEGCGESGSYARSFQELIEEKIGSFRSDEITIGGKNSPFVEVTRLPFEAPWMSPYGACLIHITDLRRNDDGVVEFQLGDENGNPYEGGDAWCFANDFRDEWPD